MTSKGTGIHWYISPRRLVRNEHKVTKRAIGGPKQAKLTMSLDVITQSMTSAYVGTSSTDRNINKNNKWWDSFTP